MEKMADRLKTGMQGNSVIAVMFSGGVDSTYAAWSQIKIFDTIRLITFVRTGFRNRHNLHEIINRLCRAFPEKEIFFELVDFEEIYQQTIPHKIKLEVQREILSQKIGPLWEDPHGACHGSKIYNAARQKLFMVNECLQCKISMHIAAIKFCLENHIHNICDGSNPEQLDDGSQLEDVKSIGQDIFREYGINFFSPAFNISADERSKILFDEGITDFIDHKHLEKTHRIPSRQIQCTVPASALWTICVFPWLVYDAASCDDYVAMSCRYYFDEMKKGLSM